MEGKGETDAALLGLFEGKGTGELEAAGGSGFAGVADIKIFIKCNLENRAFFNIGYVVILLCGLWGAHGAPAIHLYCLRNWLALIAALLDCVDSVSSEANKIKQSYTCISGI